MWYRRFVSWFRSLFTIPSQVNAQPTPRDAGAPTLPTTAPLHGPVGSLDQSAPPLPAADLPPRHEPPTTVPLARLARPSQPLTGMPMNGDGIGSHYLLWSSREPSPPSPPAPPLRPLTGSPRSSDAIGPEPGRADMERDDEDDLASFIEPGSDLYRRLMILRRLVRQRVYNEGFPAGATPEQYLRLTAQDDFDNPFSAQE